MCTGVNKAPFWMVKAAVPFARLMQLFWNRLLLDSLCICMQSHFVSLAVPAEMINRWWRGGGGHAMSSIWLGNKNPAEDTTRASICKWFRYRSHKSVPVSNILHWPHVPRERYRYFNEFRWMLYLYFHKSWSITIGFPINCIKAQFTRKQWNLLSLLIIPFILRWLLFLVTWLHCKITPNNASDITCNNNLCSS